MSYLIAYVAALVIFGGLDAIWLTTMGGALYRSTLGDILAPDVRLAPAIAFYLLFPVGIVAFGVAPAFRADSFVPALAFGALFGALAYATYDLTNFATLRTWSLQITVIDIAYGAIASGVTAALAFLVARSVSNWF